MLSDFLKKNLESQAKYVEYGYGQVEPNHLSAQRTGQIYAQLPANKDIKILENGQFVKYDYAAENGGEVNFEGAGEWMLVFNEIKLYREGQLDCEFAMKKSDYRARVYSPYDWENSEKEYQPRFYGDGHYDWERDADGKILPGELKYHPEDEDDTRVNPERVTVPTDPYEIHYNEDPFRELGVYHARKMPEGTTMVPRVFKTNIGDIFTTNTIDEEELALGDTLSPNADNGILSKSGDGSMTWQVVRVYTMPDGQRGVKIMRIA